MPLPSLFIANPNLYFKLSLLYCCLVVPLTTLPRDSFALVCFKFFSTLSVMAGHALVYAVLFLTSAISFKSGNAQIPGQFFMNALLCFNGDNIYSSCNEQYRLTQSGNLNIPPPATNQFCYGPCLAETHLVLDCIDHSLSNFIFYNKATVKDIRAILQAACSHTHERGNFKVEQYMQSYLQDDWGSANLRLPNLFTLIFTSSILALVMTGAL